MRRLLTPRVLLTSCSTVPPPALTFGHSIVHEAAAEELELSCSGREIRFATPLEKNIDALGDSALDGMVRFGNRGGGGVGCGVGSHCRWMY